MSYDIDNWKTKKLKGLTVPLAAFFEHKRDDWHPEVIADPASNAVTLNCGCGQEIKGTLTDGIVTIGEFDMSGEGSGTFYMWILEPALRRSSGSLEAVLVWEGGDSITRLRVRDGIVSSEGVEI